MSLDSDIKTKNSHCHSGCHLLRVYTSKMSHPIGPAEPTVKWLQQVVLVWFCQIDSHHSDTSKGLTEQPPEYVVASHMFLLTENGPDMKIPGSSYFSRLCHYELIGCHSDCNSISYISWWRVTNWWCLQGCSDLSVNYMVLILLLYNHVVSSVNMYPPLNNVFAQDLLINLGSDASWPTETDVISGCHLKLINEW